MDDQKYKIYFIQYDDDGKEIGRGVYHREYVYMSRALTIAREYYGDRNRYTYKIAKRNPWMEYTGIYECCVCRKEFTAKQNANGIYLGTRISINEEVLTRFLRTEVHGTTFIAGGKTCPECHAEYVELTERLRNGFEKKTRPYTLGELPEDDIYADR